MNRPVLFFDVGNTCVKVIKLASGKIKYFGKQATARLINYNVCLNWLDEVCKNSGIGMVDGVVVCSVLPNLTELLSQVIRDMFGVKVLVLTNGHAGFAVPYEGFGIDRTMALLGAKKLYAGKACIVVDVGTSITVDAISNDGSVHAGLITPGPDIMLESLAGKSGRLPLLKFKQRFVYESNSTEACMQYGVTCACTGTIREAISGFQNGLFHAEPAIVIGTGGYIDAVAETGLLSCVEPDLVFAGCIDAYSRHSKMEVKP